MAAGALGRGRHATSVAALRAFTADTAFAVATGPPVATAALAIAAATVAAAALAAAALVATALAAALATRCADPTALAAALAALTATAAAAELFLYDARHKHPMCGGHTSH